LKEIGKTAIRAKPQRVPRFGKMNIGVSLPAWRPFDFAQGRLGAIKFFVTFS
jgi:hypothetical protein